MVAFSKILEATLHRSLDVARARKHDTATLEHLLLALINDSDAAKVLRACNVDLDQLRQRLATYIDTEIEPASLDATHDIAPAPEFQRVIHRAVVHVQSSGREKVTGANVLIAIFAERDSLAALYLKEQGITRFDAVQYVAHGTRPLTTAAKRTEPPQVVSAAKPVAVRKIFISYRRDDSSGHTGRVHDRLEREFGRDLLFMDVDAIPLGVNFVKFIRDEVAKCDAMLAVIGPNWLSATDETGQRRIDRANDFVRLELAEALQRDIPVIPILVDGVRMPSTDSLPDELKELSLRNGLDVRHSSFHADMDKLVRALRERLGRT